ncbi:MarR family winged helix-turn-helix transcriptional regulator [Mycobacteriaceae bacterium NPDC060252]
MSRANRNARQIALAEGFTAMGQAWIRWVHASVPDDAVSYARLRVLTALEGNPDGLTMSGIAAALAVTGRRVTVLVDALAEDGLVARYAHPTDKRSTIIEITETGLAHQRQVWQEHQRTISVAFDGLSDDEQVQLLAISHKLTDAFRRRLAEHSAPPAEGRGDQETVLIRNNRLVRAARPISD